VYHQNPSNFHKIRTNSIKSVRYGVPKPLTTNHIDIQISKSPSRNAMRWGFCHCPRQLAGENFANLLPQNLPRFNCSIAWQSGLPRHIFPDENQMAYHHNGEAECVLPQSLDNKAKSRQRVRWLIRR